MKIVLIDDHPMFREGVKQILAKKGDYSVIGEASTLQDTSSLLAKLGSDVVSTFFVIDISLPDGTGFEILSAIAEAGGNTMQCVILSMHDDIEYAEHALEAGASGYIVKSDNPNSLLDCLDAINRGETYFSESIHKKKERSTADSSIENSLPDAGKQIALLSKRELAVLKLVAEEKTSREISETLFLSQRTVENHRAKICGKLGVTGAHGLIAYAIKHKALIEYA